MFKKKVVSIITSLGLLVSACSISASAAYLTFNYTGTSTVYSYTANGGSLSKQLLDSYTWENYTDQKKSKAVVTNYGWRLYYVGNSSYYGWLVGASNCYARAQVGAKNGTVYEDSGRVFGYQTATAETKEPVIGICYTYCGNTANNT
ncbi:MAG: hypothetical protein GX286_03725 [Clostridiales bacterium]|jgi:hypothetical protein|nr:hypothetical protein [Clostridiales bacterium]